MLEEVWWPGRPTFLKVGKVEQLLPHFFAAYNFNVLLKSTLTDINFMFSAGCETILVMLSSFPITLFHALLPSLIYFKPVEGKKRGREMGEG